MNSELNKIYEIRDYKPEDKAFIMATWLRGLYYGDSWFSEIPKDIFMNNYKLILEALLLKNIVKVACLCEDRDVIVGYSVLSHDFTTIHWVFVKSAWRKQGIGRQLVPKYPSNVTHLTTLGKSLMKKLENCIFNPFNV
jgi:GNAT superfamily N-acetyltransferase